MNLLTNNKLLTDTFASIAEPVLVNGTEQLAYITNAHLGMDSRRHMHSLQPFNQGDYVEFAEGTYMVIEDVVNARGATYKSTIEHCNYLISTPSTEEKIRVGTDSFGRPIYDIIITPGKSIHVILDNDKLLFSGSQITVNNTTIKMFVQDNENNREDFMVNEVFEVYGKNLKIKDVGRLRVGLLEITLDVVAS